MQRPFLSQIWLFVLLGQNVQQNIGGWGLWWGGVGLLFGQYETENDCSTSNTGLDLWKWSVAKIN